MPSWTRKDERKFEHIKESSRRRGIPERRAQEIAGRTVNKGRRLEGRTPRKTTRGTGNPNLPLSQRTVPELRNIARDLGIRGRSSMNKSDLVRAIRGRR